MAEPEDVGAARVGIFEGTFGKGVEPASPQERREIESAILILINHVLADASIVGADLQAAIASIDRQLTEQIDEILHAPCFQQREATWRGLRYLVDNSATDTLHKIQILDVTKDDLWREMEEHPNGHDVLLKAVHDDRYATADGDPLAFLVGDFEVDHRPQDVKLLRAIGEVAATAHTPFMTAVEPYLFGVKTWSEFNPEQDLAALLSTTEYAAWRGLRRQTEAAYLAVCMPRILARLPYRSGGIAAQDFAYKETIDPGGPPMAAPSTPLTFIGWQYQPQIVE